MDTLKVEKPHLVVPANASSAAVLPSGGGVTSEVQPGHLAWLQLLTVIINKEHAPLYSCTFTLVCLTNMKE